MKVVVTTPTGHVGSRVVRLLLQGGLRPTLLLRDPAKLDPQTRPLVDVVQGEQGDVGTVGRATCGPTSGPRGCPRGRSRASSGWPAVSVATSLPRTRAPS